MYKVISYIGSKVKLFDFLNENMFNNFDSNKKLFFYDGFAGTNSVSKFCLDNTKWDIYTNDFMNYSFRLSHFLNFNKISISKRANITKILIAINEKIAINENLLRNGDIFNEFSINGKPKSIDSDIFTTIFDNQPFNSRMFFSEIVGIKIDFIKNEIIKLKENGLSEIETNILMVFLLNYADKNANTTSVYGAYLKNQKKTSSEKLFLDIKLLEQLNLEVIKQNKLNHFNLSILDFINKISTNKSKNILYFDPPYSTRSYESNYHILEYISNFDFSHKEIKQNSKTGQSNLRKSNPFAKKRETFSIFFSMIEEGIKKADNIFISYSTDGLMKEEDLNKIFSKLKEIYPKLEFLTYKKEYKRFKSADSIHKKKQEQNNKKDSKTVIIDKDIKGDSIQKELFEIIWHFRNNI